MRHFVDVTPRKTKCPTRRVSRYGRCRGIARRKRGAHGYRSRVPYLKIEKCRKVDKTKAKNTCKAMKEGRALSTRQGAHQRAPIRRHRVNKNTLVHVVVVQPDVTMRRAKPHTTLPSLAIQARQHFCCQTPCRGTIAYMGVRDHQAYGCT